MANKEKSFDKLIADSLNKNLPVDDLLDRNLPRESKQENFNDFVKKVEGRKNEKW